jgi:hypothetical protein
MTSTRGLLPFLGGLLIFFLGERGGRESARARSAGSVSGRHALSRHLFRIRQHVDLVHTFKTMEGLLFLVPPRTPRSSGYDVYAHVVYVVICYMSVIGYMSVICLVLGSS